MGIRLEAALVAATVATPAERHSRTPSTARSSSKPPDEAVGAGAQGVQVRAHADSDHFTGCSGKAELEGNRPVPHNGRHRVGSLDRKNHVQFSATA
ncbi:hypothetical protein C8D88_12128 [Lentzea atacamensis]|uniref:Uncharacterized protein n=1 Tax=Lentzea atacamensis TaxID=531938 RepID=A0A316HRD6_9PSEU|nr:hypothetical protein [Lentzea atacamensis]PWK80858.1 hypothetical protein C8D88_12128 [Lentzea atacamensis]